MPLQSLRDLYIDELQDLYDAERQIMQALPGMVRSAASVDLKRTFEQHLEQTRGHLERLERILTRAERPVEGRRCDGIAGIIQENARRAEPGGDAAVRDATLIGTALRIEHYEIAAYGCARTHARQLGLDEAAALLQQTLDEEEATDARLSGLGGARPNWSARQARGRTASVTARTAGEGPDTGDLLGPDFAPADSPTPRPYQVDEPEWVLSHGRATVGHRVADEPAAARSAEGARGAGEPMRRQRLDEDFDGEQSER